MMTRTMTATTGGWTRWRLLTTLGPEFHKNAPF